MALDSLIPIMGILLVMIPVAGLTLGLTLRLAVKPFVETLAAALRESRSSDSSLQMGPRLERIEDDLEALTYEVRALRSAQEFDRTLLADRTEPATPHA